MPHTTRKTAQDFDPAVMRLFDQYVHGLIDRRGFLKGTSGLAISTAAATGLLSQQPETPGEKWARELGLEAISHAMKPAPFALKAGLKRLGATADEAVLIGDQLYTDVWSGNFAGVDTILVKPQATQDLWYTQIFRIFERRALRDLPCEE